MTDCLPVIKGSFVIQKRMVRPVFSLSSKTVCISGLGHIAVLWATWCYENGKRTVRNKQQAATDDWLSSSCQGFIRDPEAYEVMLRETETY